MSDQWSLPETAYPFFFQPNARVSSKSDTRFVITETGLASRSDTRVSIAETGLVSRSDTEFKVRTEEEMTT